MAKTVHYPGPSVPPEMYDVEQIHHIAQVRIARGPVTIEDDAIADQLVEAGLFSAAPTAESKKPRKLRTIATGSSCIIEGPGLSPEETHPESIDEPAPVALEAPRKHDVLGRDEPVSETKKPAKPSPKDKE